MAKQSNDNNIIEKSVFVQRASEMPIKDVPMEEIGGTIRLRAMTTGARDQFLRDLLDEKIKPADERVNLLQRCIVDESNELMFSEDELDVIGAMSPQILDKLTPLVQELNWMHPGAVEEAEGNSLTVPD